MSIGPTVLKPRAVPLLTTVCLVLAVAFVALGFFLDGTVRTAAFGVAAAFVLVGGWNLFQSRRSAVLIDTHQFIVKDGGKQTSFEIDRIESVDLSRLRGHVRFTDGTSITLPLDGNDLLEAGLLLNPSGRNQ
ncbi:MAG: hypothetical protein AAGA65_18285 [Actinomycetota bacterium]